MSDVRVVRAVAPELREIAGRLDGERVSAGGVALARRLLSCGGSPLYGDETEPLRAELDRIRTALEPDASSLSFLIGALSKRDRARDGGSGAGWSAWRAPAASAEQPGGDVIPSEVLVGLALAVAVIASAWLSRRTRVPEPSYLVLAGLAVSFAPRIAAIRLPPHVVFYGFLPPLLYGMRRSQRTWVRSFGTGAGASRVRALPSQDLVWRTR